jgi:hypothetical protein
VFGYVLRHAEAVEIAIRRFGLSSTKAIAPSFEYQVAYIYLAQTRTINYFAAELE